MTPGTDQHGIKDKMVVLCWLLSSKKETASNWLNDPYLEVQPAYGIHVWIHTTMHVRVESQHTAI